MLDLKVKRTPYFLFIRASYRIQKIIMKTLFPWLIDLWDGGEGCFKSCLQHSCVTLMSDCAGVFVSMLRCVNFPPRHTFLPSGSMKITETRISDSGMYLCVATNIAGNVTQSVKLSVHGEY